MRQELSRDLEATSSVEPPQTAEMTDTVIPCSITLNGFGIAIFNPSSLTVASGNFVQFTVTNVAGSLSVPANIFGSVGPFPLAPNTPHSSVKIPVLPNLPFGVYGNGSFPPSSPPGITGTITIGTGSGPGEGD